jgi:hypothetical protein
MKSFRIAIASLLVLFTAAAGAQSEARSSFAKLKSLEGTWTGKNTQGQPLKVLFRTTSAGSAVLSEIEGKEDMITMFHMDGDRLMMTHYCTTGNQPRMLAKVSPDGKILTFNFFDATNLNSPRAGHMQRMVLTVIDENHHTEDWTFVGEGKELHEHFELERKS